MSKKYILTDKTIKFRDHILHRIKVIKSFGNVKKAILVVGLNQKKFVT